ncbi:DUF4907 domain-containing protein [Proteiniphilum sp.]|uniref:DUF4907 domain-containing protein n=1 Tax=Proteiniphilum sp. TaxID=1926877 RepID=UPI002B21CB8E|nr:DUF4907 domain-containing protein [Proteiniphilum sp.]MEA4918236.1 DUF4907 domain-containing protein [Proteiniphilum sp.]
MIKRVSIIILSVIAVTLLIYFSLPFSIKNESSDIYKVETFKSGNGWGYQISKNDKVIILQPYIPCITGGKPFPDKKSALDIGEIVVSKIRNGGDPSITVEELSEKINISD